GALAGKGDSRGATHAAVAAGDQRLAARQPARAFVAFLAMIRRRLHLGGQAGPGLFLLLEWRLGVLLLRISRMGKRLLVLIHSEISSGGELLDQLVDDGPAIAVTPSQRQEQIFRLLEGGVRRQSDDIGIGLDVD